jgi:hypothetical protein
MDKQLILEFIAKAHRNTYAATKEIKLQHRLKTPFLPGHKCYYFKDGEWEYFDGYSGIEWAPGREVVLFQNKPIWSMSYQGQTPEGLSDKFIEETFDFLKKALRNFDSAMPFRGPAYFKEGDFEYTFEIKGDYRYFTGREAIQHKGKEVFFQDVMGSLIK